ncbi:MAG TPA: phage holin family protein, partial [Patescibacteria group bacterium]|nr:phage holin family protein [Patescibacteria group bacterium]
MSLIDLYKTQLRVLWEWRGGPWALFKRLVLILLVSTISFLATSWLLPRITVDSFWAAAFAVVLMALFNAIVRTVLLAFVAARSLILTGILVIVLQVVAFLIVAQWAPGVHVDGFLTALIGSFVFAFINTVLT